MEDVAGKGETAKAEEDVFGRVAGGRDAGEASGQDGGGRVGEGIQLVIAGGAATGGKGGAVGWHVAEVDGGGREDGVSIGVEEPPDVVGVEVGEEARRRSRRAPRGRPLPVSTRFRAPGVARGWRRGATSGSDGLTSTKKTLQEAGKPPGAVAAGISPSGLWKRLTGMDEGASW